MMRLRTLGCLDLQGPNRGAGLGAAAQPKRMALLAFLAADPHDGFHRRDTLVALFWPELDQAHARGALRKALYHLRSLGPDLILIPDDEEVRVDPAVLWCDVREFRRLAGAGAHAEALALYTGEFLPGVHVQEAPDFENWLVDQRRQLASRAGTCARELALQCRAAHQAVEAAAWAARAVEFAPLEEAPNRLLIELLDASGDRPAALVAYERFTDHLERQLQVRPGAEIRRLGERLRREPAPSSTPSQPAREVARPTRDPVASPPPRKRVPWAVPLTLVLAVFLAAAWSFESGRGRTDPALVVVAPFENRTGDATFDSLGTGLAERLTEFLARSGVTRTVPTATTHALIRGTSSRASGSVIARNTRAGLMVLGRIRARGDSIGYHAEVVRQPDGSPVGHLSPVTGSRGSARGEEALFEAVATLVAAYHDWGDDIKWGQDFFLPASLAAYRAFAEGVAAEEEGEWEEAKTRYAAALERAPGWPLASVWRAALGESADSVLAAVLAQPALLPGDRLEASHQQAMRQRAWDRWYGIVHRLYALAPRTYADYACWSSLYMGRTSEAAEYSRHLRDTSAAPTRLEWALRTCLDQALHAAGRFKEELEHALTMRREFPERPFAFLTAEIHARAGLSQRAEVDRLVRESEGLEMDWPGTRMSRASVAGSELLAHGDSAGAMAMFDRAVDWHMRRLEDGDTTLARLDGLLDPMILAGRWSEAEALLPLHRRLIRTAGDSSANLYYQAHIEAGHGNRPAALATIGRFGALEYPASERPRTRPYDLVRLYAAMGDTTQVVVHLRQAYDLGELALRRHLFWHRELPQWITGLPTFQPLVRVSR